MSSASYSGTMQGTAQRPSTANANMNPRGVVGSYDSLAKDGLNSTGKLTYLKQRLLGHSYKAPYDISCMILILS